MRGSRMLDDFLPEGPSVRVEKKPVELEGFVSELPRSAAAAKPRVTARGPQRWKRSDSSTTVVWTGCLCCVLTFGAIATPLQFRTDAREVPQLRHLRVFVAMTPVLIPAKPSGRLRPATTPKAALSTRTTASTSPRIAKAMTPYAALPPVARAAAPRRAVPETVVPAEPAPVIVTPTVVESLEAVGAAAVVRWVSEEAAVRNVLELYRGAYQQLDAQAAQRVWPNLDERRLAKAFSDLESQTLDFDECRIDVANAKSVARCRGRATYVGRVGTRTPQTHARRWTFELLKTGERWAIDSVRAQ